MRGCHTLDEDTLRGAMMILYLAKLLDGCGGLPKFLDLAGHNLELSWDNQCLAEQLACECVFQDTRIYLHEGKVVSRYERKENQDVFVLRDPLLNRYDALCRKYEAQKGVTKVENTYVRQLEDAIHQALQFDDYSYDYLWKDGTEDRKGPKIVLFLFEEFYSYEYIPEALCQILDFCELGIKRLERELAQPAAKVIPLSTVYAPEYKEAA